MRQLSKEQFLSEMYLLKRENEVIRARLEEILTLLDSRTAPVDVNAMSAEEYLRLKKEVLMSLEHTVEWNGRVLASLVSDA